MWLTRSRYRTEFQIKCVVTSEAQYASWSRAISPRPTFISNAERHEAVIRRRIRSDRMNLLISVQHPWIVSKHVLEAVRYQAFNLHNAKLPMYKGYNSISHAILNGDRSYTTTIHWMAPKVDSGDIAYEEELPITRQDTSLSLYRKTVGAAVRNFRRLIHDLSHGYPVPRLPVAGTGRFYKRSAIAALRKIRSLRNDTEVDRKSRAFYFPPHEPAYIEVSGKRLYISPKPD